MGTRHLVAVMIDGEYKVAQYGQWDGYPECQGLDILRFLSKEIKKDKFVDNIQRAKFLTPDDTKNILNELGANNDFKNISREMSDNYFKRLPLLSRNLGAKVLVGIQNSNDDIFLENNIEFAGDSLFCEYAYVIDFDKNTFEVYEGFNKKPLLESDRFYNYPVDDDSEYFPVKLLACFDMDNLPSEEEFLKVCTKADEEE